MQDNRIYKVMSKTAIASVLAASLVAPSVTQAADHDLHDGKGNSYTKTDILFDTNLIEDFLFNLPSYQYELGGKLYDFTKVNELVNAGATEETLAQKIEEAGLAGTPLQGLQVTAVKAINPTTIKVVFNQELTDEQQATSNFQLSKGTLEGVVVNGTEATLSVKGLTYGETTEVSVINPAYTQQVKVPTIEELYVLEVVTDAPSDTIKSDGAEKTMVTVTLKDRQTGAIVDEDGSVQFQITDGGLGQSSSALVDGKATVQVTSVASPTSVTAILTATIASVTGEQGFKGLSTQKTIFFSPEAVNEETSTYVSAVSAESTQGDRLFVAFSGKISAADYKKTAAATPAVGYGLNIDGNPVKVKDVIQRTENTLEFILDVDYPLSVGNDRIQAGWTPSGSKGNYLRDNVEHTLTFPSNVGSLVLANATGIKFNMTDTSRPVVYGVTAKDQLEFTVRYSESVNVATAEKAENYSIDGQKLVVNASPNSADIQTAKSNNQIIVTSITTGKYTAGKDERNLVTFKIHSDFALAAGNHVVQIANVTDYAGDVDPKQNTVETDTFDFNVAADSSVPTATITVESPEQWFVAYDKLVNNVTGKTAKDIFKIKTGNAEDTELVYGVDFTVYSTDKDGITGRELLASDSVSGQYFLIEFKKDWTEIYNTDANKAKTYYASTQNPYTVTLENVQSIVGNKADKQELAVQLSYDGTSPKMVSAVDVYTLENKKAPTLTAEAPVTAGGQQIWVTFDEPIKINSGGKSAAEGLTPSQAQTADGGVPVSTYEFVKGGERVKAIVVSGSIAANDKSFVLQPITPLTAGEWIVNIRSLTDDIGNANATEEFRITIEAAEQAVTATQLAWAAFDETHASAGAADSTGGRAEPKKGLTDLEAIYVKFTKEMNPNGANGVSRTQNYVFMGQPLPIGSKVVKGIAGVTNNWDGVTILIPKGTWDGVDTGDFSTILNIASNFTSADGEKLSGKYEVELKDIAGAASETALEAVYNNDTNGTIGGAAVISATLADENTDGEVEKVTLTTAGNETVEKDTTILVNGKVFTYQSGSGSTSLVFTTTTPIKGTDTTNVVITTSNGAILINSGSIKDTVAPIITSAALNADKTKLTVTFSEAVSTDNSGSFAALEKTDFTLNLTGGQTIDSVEHTADKANQAVLTLSAAATDALSTDTIDVASGTSIYDFAKNAVVSAPKTITGAVTVTGVTGNLGAITQGKADTPAVAATATVQDITLTANTPGEAGNNISITLVDPSNNSQSLSVSVLGNDITVNLATDSGGSITSTVNDVVAAINSDGSASALVTASGTGAVSISANGKQQLSSGADLIANGNNESVKLTVSTPATADGTLKVTLTNPNKVVYVPVTNGQTVIQIATAIKNALGTLTEYNVTDNKDGTLTFESTTAKTNVADLTVTIANQ